MATFSKDERLSGLKAFEQLTKNGNSFFSHPFRITWMITSTTLSTGTSAPLGAGTSTTLGAGTSATLNTSTSEGLNAGDEEQQQPVKIAFGVPKRNFKQAVKRNRIKRLFREAYRKHKHELYSALELKSVKITAMCIYTAKEVPSYSEAEGKIILSLRRLLNAIDGAGKRPEA